MNAIKKQFDSNTDNSYSENPIGACPGLYWVDANGNENRMIVISNINKLQSREFGIESIEQRKAVGTDEWLPVTKKFADPVASDKNYRSLKTGASESDPFEADGITLKSDIITDATFFILTMGMNPSPIGLYDYFLGALAEKHDLIIVDKL